MLRTIGGNRSSNHTNAWIDKDILPNAVIPSPAQIARAVEGLFVTEDWHNFGTDDARTLMAGGPASTRRVRGSRHAMASASGACGTSTSIARAPTSPRGLHVWQLVLSPGGVRGGYVAPR